MSQRSTFAPVVLTGLASAGLAALAGHQSMLRLKLNESDELFQSVELIQQENGVDFPLAGALGLVALACWGVLLVTRGMARRLIAALALLAGFGVFFVLILGGFVQRNDATEELLERLGYAATETKSLEATPWLWVGLLCSLIAMAAAGAAVLHAPTWPEMGARYDAPTGAGGSAASASAPPADPAEQTNLDLWKSLDEGGDPTDGGTSPSD